MGLQKYHARGGTRETMENGAVRVTGRTMWGEHLAKVENCPCYDSEEFTGRRMVYIQGEADTFFTIPAACRVKGKTVRGFITNNGGGFAFYQNRF